MRAEIGMKTLTPRMGALNTRPAPELVQESRASINQIEAALGAETVC